MTREECFKRVNTICQETFEDDTIQITDATTANDIDAWDSLTHLLLINEIERNFSIKFTMGEIQGSANIGQLIDALMNHIKN